LKNRKLSHHRGREQRLAHRAIILRSEICIETGTLTVPVLAAPAPRGKRGSRPLAREPDRQSAHGANRGYGLR